MKNSKWNFQCTNSNNKEGIIKCLYKSTILERKSYLTFNTLTQERKKKKKKTLSIHSNINISDN